MKPRIIILMHYMELGGAEISLIGLLGALDPARVDVDLFVYSHQGPLMKFIPEWVNLLPEIKAYSMLERPLRDVIKSGEVRVAAGRIVAKFQHAAYARRRGPVETVNDSIYQYIGSCLAPVLPKINPWQEYDLCISFLIPHNYGLKKVRARKKIAWIHSDYSTVHVNARKELPVWGAYDYIASISPDVTTSFLRTFPSLSNKIIEIENILSPAFVRSRAEETDVSEDMCGKLKLLSIGRFSKQKNFDNLPYIAATLVNSGFDELHWYIIGYGDEDTVRLHIAKAGMENHVIILGKKENPYPYIKACDIYVQPSRYEGKSVTVREAQMLGKPVVVTAYPTAPSQIRHGVDGVIVPLDNEGCARGLARFISDEPLRNRIAGNLGNLDFGNEAEVNKIYNLLGL
ncbi:glycosyltransferase [uncultured Duncaniella sp.]|uniref:glycosyltransferase n=1 Tax=uncultured Duncaniella sp. TaxID=2768039 RepID=UPI0025B644BF|nr:glycosyltransferase [uncultured Duncaniella sp.]